MQNFVTFVKKNEDKHAKIENAEKSGTIVVIQVNMEVLYM